MQIQKIKISPLPGKLQGNLILYGPNFSYKSEAKIALFVHSEANLCAQVRHLIIYLGMFLRQKIKDTAVVIKLGFMKVF